MIHIFIGVHIMNRVFRWIAPIACLAGVGTSMGVVASSCWIAAPNTTCCASLAPNGPNLSRYCGIWPLGNLCPDSVSGNVSIFQVSQAPIGSSSKSSASFSCSWVVNGCGLIGCSSGGIASGSCLSEAPLGSSDCQAHPPTPSPVPPSPAVPGVDQPGRSLTKPVRR